MASYSVSFQSSDKKISTSLKHNRRTPKDVKYLENKDGHIDPSRTKYNFSLVPRKSPQEAYDEIFGQDVKDYNARLKARGERHKSAYIDETTGGYWRHVQKYKRLTPTKEFIVQIGNKNHHPHFKKHNGETQIEADARGYKGLFKHHLAEFEKRNPNLYILDYTVHMDEGTPHAHVVVIPIAQGYKQGMRKRPSFNKAMGFPVNSEKNKEAFADWTENERNAIADELKRYGQTRKIVNNPHKHQEPAQYRATMAEAKEKAEKLLSDAQKEANKIVSDADKDVAKKFKAKEDSLAQREETVSQKELTLTARETAVKKREDDADKRDKELDERENEADIRDEELDKKESRIKKALTALNTTFANTLATLKERGRKYAKKVMRAVEYAQLTYKDDDNIQNINDFVDGMNALEEREQKKL